jgi:peptide/nickel transport system substrate-binding protein
MNFRLQMLRLVRRFKKGQKQFENFSSNVESNIDKFVFERFDRLKTVRRFILGWIGLVIILMIVVIGENFSLSGYYQKLQPVAGGIYNEGIPGSFTNANPIYATSDADTTVSKLIFSGLFTLNTKGQLVGDLAKSITTTDYGKTYTVDLKPNLKWQDGKPLTSSDVAFTIRTIQDPDAQSPLFSDWSGITVTTNGPSQVTFHLPDPLASFPYELTTGIIPEHLLGSINPDDLRSASFNTVHPVGSGPFSLQALQVIDGSDPSNEQVQIALNPFADYARGKPKLSEFAVHVYANEQTMDQAFKNKQLTAIEAVEPPSKKLQDESGVVDHNLILRAENMVFFKTDAGVLADSNVRQALVQAANVPNIISKLGYETVPVNEPLLIGQLGYNKQYAQSKYDLSAARAKLTSDGYAIDKNGYFAKGGTEISFVLTTINNSEYNQVATELKDYWQKLGVKMTVQSLDAADFQSALNYHDYDAVLTSISIGTDPDVFAYWDSSQADPRSTNQLNFSEYKNSIVDTALESGRTRIDPALRIIKYQPFLQQWQADAPALGLYQPRLLYMTNGPVKGLSDTAITTPTDRFYNVSNWEIEEAKVTQ